MTPCSSSGLCFWLCALGLLASVAIIADAGWCHWLSWTCENNRLRFFGPGSTDRIQCAPHRSRFCCNSEPPSKSDTSCTGSSEEWLSSYDWNISCWPWPSEVLYVPHGQPANACSSAYPRFYIMLPFVATTWCPWDYWESWQIPASGNCCSQRVRRRRCACADPKDTFRNYCSGNPELGTEAQGAGCSVWCAWSEWTAVPVTSPPLQQRRRTCDCDGGFSGGLSANSCQRGEAELASMSLVGNQLSTTSLPELSSNRPWITTSPGVSSGLPLTTSSPSLKTAGSGASPPVSDAQTSDKFMVLLVCIIVAAIILIGAVLGLRALLLCKRPPPCATSGQVVFNLSVLPSAPPAVAGEAAPTLDVLPPPYEAQPHHWMQPPPAYSSLRAPAV